jgi:N utilization substance protein B
MYSAIDAQCCGSYNSRGTMTNAASSSPSGKAVESRIRQLTRRDARRKVFELLFELEQHPGLSGVQAAERSFEPEVEIPYLTDEDAEGYAAGRADRKTREYITALVTAADERRDLLDAELARYPLDWSYERLGITERVLLRMALAEIVFTGTEHKVVINEVIELAKLYADEDAARFVNGMLGSAVGNIEAFRASLSNAPPAGSDSQ